MNGQSITLDRVAMRFGAFTAVDGISMRIEPGEFFSFLGPSGCGKTTILRMISGFMEPSEGRVLIGDKDMAGIGPNRRPTALIFQNLALFPLMKVWENVAFGMEVRRVDKATRRKKADELLEMVALGNQGDKLVSELSGGQKQRVAIARALAVEPSVLLLDEPLSALDLKLRQHMRAELRALQRRTGVTFVYITHDQGEALTMSDRIAVMNTGRIEQMGTPKEIYDRPQTAFCATFVGENNAFAGQVVAMDGDIAAVDTPMGRLLGRRTSSMKEGDAAILFVRPERCRVIQGEAVDNRVDTKVIRLDLEGAYANIVAEGPGRELSVHLTNQGDLSATGPGGLVTIGFDKHAALILPQGQLARS
ncbi:MAG TPA: ABC transporter ATP-binding protein [Geminicoccus sp.]|jgi:spermidine/putrescine transport system ATP-binding protein|uniref:ABC transporter ATP-binding protein n=1 Tax=Geminicoccus sp. TaxID=2024832 RepID=UPI002E34C692|nr:ABC transporter ATP-binding protein [Geminicoccus sp.]HEX2525911.1 ABC transporter ATP-binding protein [Geminicoccus sp.]